MEIHRYISELLRRHQDTQIIYLIVVVEDIKIYFQQLPSNKWFECPDDTEIYSVFHSSQDENYKNTVLL